MLLQYKADAIGSLPNVLQDCNWLLWDAEAGNAMIYKA